jgi:hypothetical protein
MLRQCRNMQTLYNRIKFFPGPIWLDIGSNPWPGGTITLENRIETVSLQLSMTLIAPLPRTMGRLSRYETSCKVGVISPHGKWKACISERHLSIKAARRLRSCCTIFFMQLFTPSLGPMIVCCSKYITHFNKTK